MANTFTFTCKTFREHFVYPASLLVMWSSQLKYPSTIRIRIHSSAFWFAILPLCVALILRHCRSYAFPPDVEPCVFCVESATNKGWEHLVYPHPPAIEAVKWQIYLWGMNHNFCVGTWTQVCSLHLVSIISIMITRANFLTIWTCHVCDVSWKGHHHERLHGGDGICWPDNNTNNGKSMYKILWHAACGK